MLDCYESSPVIGEWEMACGFCFDYVEVLKTLDKAVSDGWSNDGSKDALDTPAKARAAVQKLLNRRFPEASLAQRAAIATLFAEGGLAPGPERDVAVRALRACILIFYFVLIVLLFLTLGLATESASRALVRRARRRRPEGCRASAPL